MGNGKSSGTTVGGLIAWFGLVCEYSLAFGNSTTNYYTGLVELYQKTGKRTS
jgi:hypothetical protein